MGQTFKEKKSKWISGTKTEESNLWPSWRRTIWRFHNLQLCCFNIAAHYSAYVDMWCLKNNILSNHPVGMATLKKWKEEEELKSKKKKKKYDVEWKRMKKLNPAKSSCVLNSFEYYFPFMCVTVSVLWKLSISLKNKC